MRLNKVNVSSLKFKKPSIKNILVDGFPEIPSPSVIEISIRTWSRVRAWSQRYETETK